MARSSTLDRIGIGFGVSALLRSIVRVKYAEVFMHHTVAVLDDCYYIIYYCVRRSPFSFAFGVHAPMRKTKHTA